MKTKYDFPYQFVDLTASEQAVVKFDYSDTTLSVSIDLTAFEFIAGTDVVIEFESSQTFFRKLFVLNKNFLLEIIILAKIIHKIFSSKRINRKQYFLKKKMKPFWSF